MNARQLKEVVIVPSLIALGLESPAAVNLMLGTCAQESAMGQYLVQQNIGFKGGIGIYQMQRLTYDDIWNRKIEDNVAIKARIRLMLGYDGKPPADRMASDLKLATVMTRLFYAAISDPLPDQDDIRGLGAYWKKFYNSAMGKGTIDEFVTNYRKYVGV